MTDLDKKFAYELTLEFIRQNNLFHCSKTDIHKQMDYIAEVENIISDYVEKNHNKFRTL